LIDFGLLDLEKKIELLNFSVIFTISLLTPLGGGYSLPLKTPESSPSRIMICAKSK
jgi:hypothetical protein